MDRLPHDFYHRAEYHLLAERRGEGTACLAVYGDSSQFVAWPYLLVPLTSVPGLEFTDRFDITSVYGYPGPLSRDGAVDRSFLSEAAIALQELWRTQNVVSVFTRTNPFLNHSGLFEHFGTLVPAGQTISVDLQIPLHESWAQVRRGHRYEIQKGQEAGLTICHDQDWRRLSEFISLYRETMQRRAAEGRYLFDQSYFAAMREMPHGAACHLLLALLHDEVSAGAIFTECYGVVQYHLSATRQEYRHLSPAKVLLDRARVWAKGRGNKLLHLGSGVAGAEDSLFQFKAGFSNRRHPFFVWRMVLDQATYDLLAAARAKYCATHGLLSASPGFFPSYRQPLVTAEQFSHAGA